MLNLAAVLYIVYYVYDAVKSFLNIAALPKVPVANELPKDLPLISLLIPARNEAVNIAKCLSHIEAQTYPNLEIIVVNDHSTDGTVEVVKEFQAKGLRKIQLFDAPDLPEGWLGKNHALDSAVQHATGSWLLFVDADVELRHPQCIASTVAVATAQNLDLFSMMEEQSMESFWERACLPALLDSVKLHTHLRRVADPKSKEGLACGVYLLFRRAAYEAIGGHKTVANTILEDFAFGRIVKERGLRLGLMHGQHLISVRQYPGLARIWRGWSKNLLGMIGNSAWGYLKALVYLTLPTLIPVGLALTCFQSGLTWVDVAVRVTPLVLISGYKLGLNLGFKVSPLYTPLTMTLGSAFATFVHLNVIWSFYVKREVSVVNRVYSKKTLTKSP